MPSQLQPVYTRLVIGTATANTLAFLETLGTAAKTYPGCVELAFWCYSNSCTNWCRTVPREVPDCPT